jgi:predicted PurR-regulated permease PerM
MANTASQYRETDMQMNPWKRKLADLSPQPGSSPKPTIVNPEAAEPADAQPVRPTAWMEDKRLSFFVLLSLTAVAMYLVYLILHPFLTSLFVALILAIAFSPLQKRLTRWLRNSYLAALVTTALVILVILLPFIFISARLATQTVGVYSTVLQPFSNAATWPGRLNPFVEEIARETGIPPEELKSTVSVHVRSLGTWLLGAARTRGQFFAQQITTIGLSLFVFLFPMLRHGSEFRASALSMLPFSPERARELGTALNQAIIADIYGMFAVGIAEGILIAIGFWITRLPAPLLWGAVAICLSFLPFVGVSMVWIGGSIYLALQENWTFTGILVVWGLMVVSIAEGFVRSRVVSGRARVNSLFVTLSIMGGVVAFSWVGIFVGPVVMVLFSTLIRILREEHADLQDLET